MMAKTFLTALLVVGSLLHAGAGAQTATPHRTRVVFQVSDGDTAKWGLTLNNVNNVLQDLGADKVDIEIVAYGPGIGMLKADAVVANRVADAVQGGVRVVACENTMRAQKLVKADMNQSVGYVPAGVVELIKRQGAGWAYIRP